MDSILHHIGGVDETGSSPAVAECDLGRVVRTRAAVKFDRADGVGELLGVLSQRGEHGIEELIQPISYP